MILSCIYLGYNGNNVLISNLQFETKSGRKYWETFYKDNLILDYLKVISRWESWIGVLHNKLHLKVYDSTILETIFYQYYLCTSYTLV